MIHFSLNLPRHHVLLHSSREALGIRNSNAKKQTQKNDVDPSLDTSLHVKQRSLIQLPVSVTSHVHLWRKVLHTVTPWQSLKDRVQHRVQRSIKHYFEQGKLIYNPYHVPNEQEPIPEAVKWNPKTGVVAQPIHEVLSVLLEEPQVPGVMFGEIHDSPARNQVLLDHMPRFAKKGLCSIFLEGFADHPTRGSVSQGDLDDYQDNPTPETRKKLQDKMKLHFQGGETLYKVIETAVHHGVRCYGVEDWSLYADDDEIARSVVNHEGQTVTRTNENYRDAQRNMHWAKVIQEHASRGKFFVLAGNFHSYDGARLIPEKDDKYFGVDHLLPGVMAVDVVDERCKRHPIFKQDPHEYLDFPSGTRVGSVFVPLDPAQRAQADFVYVTPVPTHPQRFNQYRPFKQRRPIHTRLFQKTPLVLSKT
ncbi:MAG: hypothetical protein ACKO37_07930 [Vampirovibrionales bacterium]